jgi:hydrogenase expression/formation protein HypD
MKYLEEFRDPDLAQQYLTKIDETVTQPWTIMEVCGGQTHSLVKNGILNLLPDALTMVHGPGCPVCVTPLNLIDKAIYLAEERGVMVCSFGDMVRVPGSERSLLEAKARGADVRIVYSPLEAVKLAKQNPGREVIFFAVGFETTAPANALSITQAYRMGLSNYSILASQVLVPPAIQAVMEDDESSVEGFLGAGHVCTIMGNLEYYPLVEKFHIPIVVTGFEPVDLLQGILRVVWQLENGEARVENQYARMVREEGNLSAQEVIFEVFEVTDRLWRGMRVIPMSGYEVKEKYANYDAKRKYSVDIPKVQENPGCIAGEIMKGIKKPTECSNFGTNCTPLTPLGAPMVSSEGACAAYYHFSGMAEKAASGS